MGGAKAVGGGVERGMQHFVERWRKCVRKRILTSCRRSSNDEIIFLSLRRATANGEVLVRRQMIGDMATTQTSTPAMI